MRASMQTTNTVLMIRPARFAFNPDTAFNNRFQQPFLAPEQAQQKALEEFEQFKRQSRVRETKIMQESQDKIQKLTKELDMARDEFSGQVSKFSQLAQQIEVKYSKDSVNMKEVHAKEIEDLVQKYNKQYNDMLTRMMNEQDELEKRLQKEFEDKIRQEILERRMNKSGGGTRRNKAIL